MSSVDSLPYGATLEQYERQAQALFDALQSGDDAAHWRFKWEHPRFRGKSVTEVRSATLDLTDAQLVIAHTYAFETWTDLAAFTDVIARDASVALFETAVEAVISGDVTTLSSIVREHPSIVRARSTRRHHATLLHYVAANGVEGARQRTPANAVEVAKILLEAGAEVDALADMYEAKCTTMSMLVSSSHPHQAGLQAALAATLLSYGAAFEGPGSHWQSSVLTALAFGYLDTAATLVKRGAPVNNVAATAGLGWLEETVRRLPLADAASRHIALALAAQHGHTDIVRLLLDAGEDPDRYNPEGYHSHSTPLHQAVSSNHLGVVQLLVERGARLDIEDLIYQGTPLDWAVYLERTAIAEYIRGAAQPDT
ncbi:MAG: ankyrin repeat domain-containing protein [Gemmatimonadetes bacterium]|nr:ankyrin repeat domain-containing protein [Gemmatimonadota bacterium]